MEQNKKKQVAKISVFITSIFVIFLSITYAFINMTLTGTKRQVITAGNLELELLEDDNNLTIANAMPMYDEVGMIQDAFTFRLVNKTSVDTNYALKLVKTDSDDELYEEMVRFHLSKDGDKSTTARYLSDLNGTFNEQYSSSTRKSALKLCQEFFPNNSIVTEENCVQVLQEQGDSVNNFDEFIADLIEEGAINRQILILENDRIKGNQTIEFQYRMWIDENIGINEAINGKSLSYKIEISASQDIEKVKSIVFNKIAENLEEKCETYDDGTDIFLIGECQNNYVWYSGKLWRVVLKNNETGAIKLVTDNVITYIPYNAEGNITFENSYMDQWLQQEFLPTLHDAEQFLVTNSAWDVTANSSYTPARPNGTPTVNRTVGLLNSYEYFTASALSSGSSNGYLNKNTSWYTLTPQDNSYIYCVNTYGMFTNYEPTNANGVRPSVNLKSNIQIISGDGTESNPYRLEGDNKETINGTTFLNTRYSGEYINFNSELYRIVGTENNLTKIVAVNEQEKLSSKKFHSDNTITSFASASIKTDLETYYQELDETTKNMIEPNTKWYLGTVGTGTSYKASICATVEENTDIRTCVNADNTTANIGLSRIGEMFTSNIKGGENLSVVFWTLTPSSTNKIWNVEFYGLREKYPSPSEGVPQARPSMYLKSNVVIAKDNTGDGTYEHPYDIELGS